MMFVFRELCLSTSKIIYIRIDKRKKNSFTSTGEKKELNGIEEKNESINNFHFSFI